MLAFVDVLVGLDVVAGGDHDKDREVYTNAPDVYTPELRIALLLSHSGLLQRKRRLFETSILLSEWCGSACWCLKSRSCDDAVMQFT